MGKQGRRLSLGDAEAESDFGEMRTFWTESLCVEMVLREASLEGGPGLGEDEKDVWHGLILPGWVLFISP